MTPDKLLQVINQGKGQQVEFKLESEEQADLAEVMMAFANAEGGYLIVGVSDDGQVIGVEKVKTTVKRMHAATRKTEPSLYGAVAVEPVQCGEKTVIVAQVPNTLEATYSLSGRCKTREGNLNRSMSPEDVTRHAAQRGMLDYERTPVHQATLDDLNKQRVKDFLAQRLRGSIPDQPLDKVLQDIGIASSETNLCRPTIAGLLFFGNWPQLYLSHTTILAARLVGPRGIHIVDHVTIEGTLPEMIDKAVQFVQRNARSRGHAGQARTTGTQNVDKYPFEAIREALINACCHRDYLEQVPIQLKIYDDRLVIGNPGGLLPGLEAAKLEGKHKTRNPLLADWLHVIDNAEQFGTGLIRMREAIAQAGLPAPVLHSVPGWFEITFLCKQE